VSDPAQDKLAVLLEKARALPAVPGVYLMKDAKGVVVYVGKAVRLPDRVSSYFVPSADLGYKKQPMLGVVDDFDTLECESEWEALLTENRLIKDLRPRFNIRLTDDKTFPYLVITQREDFPRVFVTRNPAGAGDEALGSLLKSAKVFGPFTNVGALREAVQHLQRVFKFRTCSLDIIAGDERNTHFRPCILHAIGQCTAPCANRISPEAYRADIDRFTRFLGTRRSAMLRELRAEMEAAAGAMDYERAAVLRDQIRAIERLDDRAAAGEGWQPEAEVAYVDPEKGCKSLAKVLGLTTPLRCIEGIDIAHLQGGETVGSKVCFVDGRPFKDEYRRFRVKTVSNDDYASIREVVSRRYRDAGTGQELYPDVILIDGGLGQLHAAMDALDQLTVKPPMVISLAKKEELIYVQRASEPMRLSRQHLGLRLCQAVRDEAHRFAQAYHHILRRKKTLDEDR
jgi:excinuclease ABC subunit C